jgi:hypothetical protein
MNFLNGVLRAGIAGLSIPTIIHLFHQSRFNVVKASRVREDSPPFDPSLFASLANERLEKIDPITGAGPWMLNRADARKPARSAARRAAPAGAGYVGCRMLDVDRGASGRDGIQTESDRGEAPR